MRSPHVTSRRARHHAGQLAGPAAEAPAQRAYRAREVVGLIAGVLVAALLVACGSFTRSASRRNALPGRCPTTAPTRLPVERWARARDQITPPGATAVRLCRYSGTSAKLITSRLIKTLSVIEQLASDFNALPPATGAIACPAAGNLAQILALLAYRGAESVSISTQLTGCQTVTNGSISRTAMPRAPGGPRLLNDLKRYAG